LCACVYVLLSKLYSSSSSLTSVV